jgi:RNA polymerase sigma-70 factor (ECF subfamily)
LSDGAESDLRDIAAGDADAFARWLVGGEPRLRASLRSFARFVDVEAVLQETLLRVWTLAPKVTARDGEPDPLLRLAIRIGRNLAIDEARRTGHTVQLEPDFDAATRAPSPPDPWLRQHIQSCLDALPRKPRLAIQQRIYNGGGSDDTSLAAALRMQLNTFLQNVTRARRLLASCLSRNGVDIRAELT